MWPSAFDSAAADPHGAYIVLPHPVSLACNHPHAGRPYYRSPHLSRPFFLLRLASAAGLTRARLLGEGRGSDASDHQYRGMSIPPVWPPATGVMAAPEVGRAHGFPVRARVPWAAQHTSMWEPTARVTGRSSLLSPPSARRHPW